MVLSRRDNRRLGPHNAGLVLAGVLGGSDGRNCGEATYERVAQCHGGGSKRVAGGGMTIFGEGRAGVKVNSKSEPEGCSSGGIHSRFAYLSAPEQALAEGAQPTACKAAPTRCHSCACPVVAGRPPGRGPRAERAGGSNRCRPRSDRG